MKSFLNQFLFIVLLTFLYSTIGYSQTVGVLGTTAAQFSSATGVTSNTLSNFSVTCGTNRILVVRTSGTLPTSVTFAGTALTFIRRDESNASFGVNFFYLPLGSDCATCTSTGTSGATTGDIVVMHPFAGSIGIIATVLENVDQTNPIRAQVGDGGSTGFSPATATPFTIAALTGLQAGDGILDYAGMNFTESAGTHGAANYNYLGMTSGATDVISSTTSDEKVAAFLPVTGNGSVTPSWNQLTGNFEFHYVGAVAFAHAASNCPEGLASLTAPAVGVNNNVCPSTIGTIATPTTCCPDGSTIEYSTNSGTSWSTTLPTYDASTTQTILSRCKCDADASVVSQNGSATTSPNACTSITANASTPMCDGANATFEVTFTGNGSGTVEVVEQTIGSGTVEVVEIGSGTIVSGTIEAATQVSFGSSTVLGSGTTSPITVTIPGPTTAGTKNLVVRYADNSASTTISVNCPECRPGLIAASGNELMFGDPCFCDNPRNCNVGGVDYFHDTLTVTAGGVTGLTITAAAGATGFFTSVDCFGGSTDLITAGTVIPESPAGSGEYKLEFWRPSGVTPTLSVTESGTTTAVPAATFQPVCTTAACAPTPPIPTMSEWGLMIFGLLVLNLGVLFVQRKELA